MLPRNAQRLQVLDGCSGVLRPGRLTLLLGPPASGKTSLLKALAGKLDSSNLEVGELHRSALCILRHCTNSTLIIARIPNMAELCRICGATRKGTC